jgi:hypothetical protein
MKSLMSPAHMPYMNAAHKEFQTIATTANKFVNRGQLGTLAI